MAKEFKSEYNYYPITQDSSTKEGTADEPQTNMPNTVDAGTVKESGGSAKVTQNSIQSINYVKSVSGWLLGADGIIRSIGAVISGTITAIAGAIGGWNILSGYIYSLQSGTPTSSPSDGLVLASGNEGIIVYENTEKRVELGYISAGVYGIKGYAADGTTPIFELSDTQQIISGWTFDNAKLSSGSVSIDGTNELILMGLASAPLTGAGVYLGKDGADYEFRAGDPATGYIHWNGTSLAINGSVFTALGLGSEVAIQDWTYDGAFSVTDLNTVAWAGGTLTLMTGDTFSITGANTGDMSAFNYIYLDIAVSTTAFQVSTSFTSGTGKILIATAQNGTSEASYLMMGGAGTHNLDGGNIAASSIIAGKLSVAQLSAITADLGTITAGVVTGGTIRTASSGSRVEMTGSRLSTFKTTTEIIRTGELNGFLGYASSEYGIAIGETNKFLKYDPTNGLRMAGQLEVTTYKTAGEAITDGEAVIIGDASTYETTQLVQDGNYNVTLTTWYGQTFTVKGINIISVAVRLWNNNVLFTKTVRVAIRATSAGLPTGANLGYKDIVMGINEAAVKTFTFDTPITVTPNTEYAFIIIGISDPSAFEVWKDSGNQYSNGVAVSSADSGSTWASAAPEDIYFRIVETSTVAGSLYLADASNGINSIFTTNFIGFATATVAITETAPVILTGSTSNLTGLSVGSIYYLSNTAGAIATSAGDVSKKIGIALSATELTILNS